ncbi:hypothetical protein CXG81DRAFT_13113 [Caulochytrium protostelioides]|uniref:GOLD domain-containing protein n=1 Tax=Caulochytrium protostelioides TaxID=1555241 RepID=A0A4P9X5V1_9FUNG|nr:hypothetical protein CXG81DRAFT_13113 [Caulochytrium protostelioides]|eukprot:RKP00537.1 hypothetical protein CXG81DRAFT_13113 [Caulochytrium protostelioides]
MAPPAAAVKFILPTAPQPGHTHCLYQYIAKDTLVVGHIEVTDGPMQTISCQITDMSNKKNKYWNNPTLSLEQKFAFTTHDDADVQFCFTSVMLGQARPSDVPQRRVSLHVDTGAEAQDYDKEAREKKLKPIEGDFLRAQALIDMITAESEHLRSREVSMRDVNESTNDRVKWFSLGTVVAFTLVGAWQIMYLRRYFQAKKLI